MASHRPSGETARRSEPLPPPRSKASSSSPVAASQILIFCSPTATTRPSGVKATSLHVVIGSLGPAAPGTSPSKVSTAPGDGLAGEVVEPDLALLRHTFFVDCHAASGQRSAIRRQCDRTHAEFLRLWRGAEAVSHEIPQRESATGAGHHQHLAIRREGERTARRLPHRSGGSHARSPHPRTGRPDSNRWC